LSEKDVLNFRLDFSIAFEIEDGTKIEKCDYYWAQKSASRNGVCDKKYIEPNL